MHVLLRKLIGSFKKEYCVVTLTPVSGENYFSPYSAQQSVSFGPPPFKTFVNPFSAKNSFANCPLPPPPDNSKLERRESE
jgi:hypothetical protein